MVLMPQFIVLLVVHGFVATVLAMLAAVLLLAGRRGPASVLLSVFLGLVAVNFVAIGIHLTAEPAAGQDLRMLRVANLALALDPFYLVAFVAAYPYRRRTTIIRALLVTLGCTAAAGVVLTLIDTTPVVSPPEPAQIVLIGGLVIGYTAAWFLALGAVLDAPTPLLAQRAGWLLAAVGIAVLPRIGLAPADLGLINESGPFRWLAGVVGGNPDWGAVFFNISIRIALCAAILTISLVLARRRPARLGEFRRAGRIVVIAVAIIVLAEFAWVWLDNIPGLQSGLNVYVLRWIAFAGILVYGILRYEVTEFRTDAAKITTGIGGAFGAFAAFSIGTIWLSAVGFQDGVSLTLGLAVALGAAIPSAVLSRAIAARISAQRGEGELAIGARRLELYRAALESAYARGTPNGAGRRSLERDRKAFGVSPDEARALEHVVAMRLSRGPKQLSPGDEVLPGIVIEHELGRGAHGRALLARRVTDGERIVVKEATGDGGDAALREALALRRLGHGAIVPLRDVHVRDGRVYLLSPYVEGETLGRALARGPLGPAGTHRVAREALAALGAAHDVGVIHRDVKPSNIMIRPDGAVVLIDFGVAAIRDDATLGATVAGLSGLDELVGTVAYMAPEQARGEPAGRRADLFALGLVLIECLTGRPARDLRGASTAVALSMVASNSVDLGGVPSSWRAALARSTAPDPGDRFADAAEMAGALPPPLLGEPVP